MAPPAASASALPGTATSLGFYILCVSREQHEGTGAKKRRQRERAWGWHGREGMIFLRDKLIEVVTCVPSSAKRVK